jgi:pimeloyl-ACP methyl ester carboxylesterase
MKRTLRVLGWMLGLVVLAVAGVIAQANYAIGKYETENIAARAPGRFLTIEGRQQHFVTVGDLQSDPTGAPILMIHGFIISGQAEMQPWATQNLGAHRSLILPDMMGYGFSQRDTMPGEWSSPKSQARYLAGLLDQLGVDQVDVLGHSYGAISARFALDYPQRVRKVVYLNPGLYLPKTSTEAVIEMPLGIGRALTYHFLGNGPYGFPARLCGRQPDCGAARPARVRDTTETLRALLYFNRHSTALEDLYAEIPSLRTPGLILWGKNDPFVPFAYGERFARESGALFELRPGAGHLVWLNEPDETTRRILEFLQPTSASSL